MNLNATVNTRRLFIAINLPNELKEKIWQDYSEKLLGEELKLVRKENLHITMKFLGYFSEKNLLELYEKLSKISFEMFEAEVFGVGEFNGKVIWVGVTDKNNLIEKINYKINKALETSGEKFHPHITLARNKKLEKIKVKKIVEELNRVQFKEKFLVKSIDLMESKLSDGGAKYSILLQIGV